MNSTNRTVRFSHSTTDKRESELGIMSTLYDTAYNLFGYGAYCTPEAIAQLSAACPGRGETEYTDAVERVCTLSKCADRFCSDWYDHIYTESEAMEKIRAECPGFAEASYRGAWNRALNFVHK